MAFREIERVIEQILIDKKASERLKY